MAWGVNDIIVYSVNFLFQCLTEKIEKLEELCSKKEKFLQVRVQPLFQRHLFVYSHSFHSPLPSPLLKKVFVKNGVGRTTERGFILRVSLNNVHELDLCFRQSG